MKLTDVIRRPLITEKTSIMRERDGRTIVFVEVIDPVGAGFVMGLARPGGNTTGFSLFEFGIAGKWLELLKQITPHMTRAVVIRDPSSPGGGGQVGAIQALAPSLRVEVTSVGLRDAGEIERAVTVAREAALQP